MSMKKKFASRLANGVRQVKSQREQTPATPATPAQPAPFVKQAAKPTPAGVSAKKPVAPRTAQRPVTNLDKLHPRRIWPD